ncbi:hypothetical protein GCM10011343_15650 [Flavobacterium orientale]|uniref:Uncharacterized protein n=2 Tax=Flavobacterium orientale TaxID=1756020 RepID=A0A916Y1B6_9FLAO|nr:hypothetical protein GCM10011343_15650 [Flavobacterium orientale]
MAKVKGIIQLIGTVGDRNYYMRKGKNVSRKAGGGFDGEAIKTLPSMEKVRNNGTEMGNVSRLVKYFKLGIAPLLFSNKLPELHGRLMSLFLNVKNEDVVAERGQRTFANGAGSVAGRKLLLGYTIAGAKTGFRSLQSQVHFDWATFTLTFRGSSEVLFTFPKGVDAISFQVGVLQLGAGETGCLLTLSETVFITKGGVLPEQLVVPVEEVVTERCLAVVSLHHCKSVGGGYERVALKSGFYFEVVGVS